jgi:hypothetical protein
MSNATGIPGGTENAVDSIEPLEPGRPDVMPNPAPGDDDPASEEGEIPLDPDDEAPLEEDMSDVEANNSFSTEHPPQR